MSRIVPGVVPVLVAAVLSLVTALGANAQSGVDPGVVPPPATGPALSAVPPPGGLVARPASSAAPPPAPVGAPDGEVGGVVARHEIGSAVEDIFSFEGGAPRAYGELSVELERAIIDFARATASAQARIERNFGSLGLDFDDPAQRAAARSALQKDLSLVTFYTASLAPLEEALKAQTSFRRAQADSHVQLIEGLGRTRAAVSSLSRVAPGALGPSSPYALVILDPPLLEVTRAPGVHAIGVEALASGVQVRGAAFPADVAAAYAVDTSGCVGATLAIGERCLLLVVLRGVEAPTAVPSSVLSVDVGLASGSASQSQRLGLAVGPLKVPPELADRLAGVERLVPEAEARISGVVATLHQQLVGVMETRLTSIDDSLSEIAGERADATARLEGVSAASASADEVLRAELTEVVARIDMSGDAYADAFVALEARLADAISSLAYDAPALSTGAGDPAMLELLARVQSLEDDVVPAPPAFEGSLMVAEVTPFVDRVHILSLLGDRASLYVEGSLPGSAPTRLTVSVGEALPQRGWFLESVDAAAGRIELRSPSGVTVAVFPRVAVPRPEPVANAPGVRPGASALGFLPGLGVRPKVTISESVRIP